MKRKPRSDHMAKHFFAKLFLCEQKKLSSPACNAGGFLGTSLPSQRSAFYLINSNLSTSNIPISVIFNLGITGNAIKLKLINGSIFLGTPCA